MPPEVWAAPAFHHRSALYTNAAVNCNLPVPCVFMLSNRKIWDLVIVALLVLSSVAAQVIGI